MMMFTIINIDHPLLILLNKKVEHLPNLSFFKQQLQIILQTAALQSLIRQLCFSADPPFGLLCP